MKIKTIFSQPERFEISKLTGGFLGGAEKVRVINREDQYVLKNMGNTDAQISHVWVILNMLKVSDVSHPDGQVM